MGQGAPPRGVAITRTTAPGLQTARQRAQAASRAPRARAPGPVAVASGSAVVPAGAAGATVIVPAGAAGATSAVPGPAARAPPTIPARLDSAPIQAPQPTAAHATMTVTTSKASLAPASTAVTVCPEASTDSYRDHQMRAPMG